MASQQPIDVAGGARLHRLECDIAACCSQLRQVCLCECLVLRDQRIRNADVFDCPFSDQLFQIARWITLRNAKSIDDGNCDVIKTLSSSGADVEDAGVWMFPEMQIDIDDIVDVDKITALFAVLVAVTGLEEPNVALLAQLIECMEGHRRHSSLV